MSEEPNKSGIQPVAFEVKQPIAAVVKGGPLLEEVYYVNHGQGFPIPGPPGKGPQLMFMSGMSATPDDPLKMIGAGMYGLLAMQVTILLNEIALLQARISKLENPDPMSVFDSLLKKH